MWPDIGRVTGPRGLGGREPPKKAWVLGNYAIRGKSVSESG